MPRIKKPEHDSWLAPVARASDKKYRKMEKRVFNDPQLTARAALLDLRLMRLARAGLPADQFITEWDDPLAYPKEVKPPWAGTGFEEVLRRMPITRAGEAEHEEKWWTHFYEAARRIARVAGPVPESEKERQARKLAQSLGIIARPPYAPLTPSREAAKRRRIAAKSRSLAADLQEFCLPLAQQLRETASKLDEEAGRFSDLARDNKDRHRTHAPTQLLLQLMREVKALTGKWHHKEVAELICMAGGPAKYTADYLYKLRDRRL